MSEEKQTILIVDDERLNLKLLKAHLSVQGYTVLEAASGAEALEKAKEKPDLILLDIMMPNMDGFECCPRLKENEDTRDIPVIYLSALLDSKSKVRGLSLGGVDFISKPYDAPELLARVKTHLSLRYMKVRMLAEETIKRQNERLKDAHDEIESLYRRLQREYELAAEVFARVAPTDNAKSPSVRHISLPVSTVGGDLLLVGPRPSGGMNILLGDFTGHGLCATIGLMPVADTFLMMSQNDYSISEIIGAMNSTLRAKLPTGLYFCAAFLELNSARDSLTVWNGGMPDILLAGPRGEIKQRFPSTCLPLGIVDTMRLNKIGQSVQVAEGDVAYAYSDGLIEVCNAQGEMYGQERLEKSFFYKDDNLAVFDRIMKDFLAFSMDHPRSDDVILAAIDCGTLDGAGGFCGRPRSPTWKMSVKLEPGDLNTDPMQFLNNDADGGLGAPQAQRGHLSRFGGTVRECYRLRRSGPRSSHEKESRRVRQISRTASGPFG